MKKDCLLVVVFVLMLFLSCEKNGLTWALKKLPKLSTKESKLVTLTSASIGGIIEKDGGSKVISRGICYATTANPTINDKVATSGSGIGEFNTSIFGLISNTMYYARAFASSSIGTSYGNEISLKTLEILLPIVMTLTVDSIGQTTAHSGGNVTYDGGDVITSRGLCWSTSNNPTILNDKTNNGDGLGSFWSGIIGLSLNTKYYLRAYATNSKGTAYGNEVIFNTSSPIFKPTISTTGISSITQTAAISGGNVSNNGGSTIKLRGVCFSTTSLPTISNSQTFNGTGVGNFTSTLTGLLPNTTYYIRAYATNSVGTNYGNEISFTTLPIAYIPSLTSTIISNITHTTASSGGNILSDGGASITAKGICWGTMVGPTITNNKTTDGSGVGNFVSTLTNLSPNTTYYLRAYATNSAGTGYGSQISFATTALSLPTLTTNNISSITLNTANSGGNITSDGGTYIINRGVCWSTQQSPTILNNKTNDGSGTGLFNSTITGLTTSMTYYLRSYATNSLGTSYGNQISFTTIGIGSSYQGGIIAYILVSGDPGYSSTTPHGLIVAPYDQSASIRWYNGTYINTFAQGLTLGTGNSNTNAIVTAQGTGSYAAKLCFDLVLGGYSDWFLPSKNELNKLYLNRLAVGGFINNYYWSSSETSNTYAWRQNLTSGTLDNYLKISTSSVRAIRTF